MSARPRKRTFEAHGQSVRGRVSSEYHIWANIKYRCFNPKHHSYHLYGGRGITMCERWANSFAAFYEDMGPRPSKRHSIDRIDNSKGYEPSNCRWATPWQQAQNRRDTISVDADGEKVSLKVAAERAGLPYDAVLQRIVRRGWSVEKALTTPLKKGRLTEADIRAIRESAVSQQMLARRYRVDPSYISKIRSGECGGPLCDQ